MKVIKRKGNEEDFCLDKIINAINLANNSVEESLRMNEEQIQKVVNTVLKKLEGFNTINVEDINDFVESALVRHNRYQVSKNYILYREKKNNNKKFTVDEERILKLIEGDTELRGDNANKHIDDNGSIRDYIAGIKCKTIAEKILPREIVEAHKKGLIHWHDMDYSPIQPLHNCFLGGQKFITAEGVKKFSDYLDGDIVYVRDAYGKIRKATVHTYGKQKVNEVVFKMRNGTTRTVYCTSDHGWILSDGTRTTNLSVGDRLFPSVTSNSLEELENAEDYKIWCLGFILGDGCGHYQYTQVRLCGNKNKYIENFKKSECFRIRENKDGDYTPYTKSFSKQDFLNGKGWRILSPHHKAILFYGLMAADGRTNANNIVTADDRIMELIEECSGIGGYFITSKTEQYLDTPYKKNAYTCTYRFLSPQQEGYGWKVESIKPYRHGEEKVVYCIVEPETHSFMLENGIPTSNCDLCNVEDMFRNGFMMGDTKIEPNSETPFRTACNLLAQINLIVSGRQYGGQTVSWSHLLPFIQVSRNNIRKEIIADWEEDGVEYNEEKLNKKVEKKLRKEIKEGVKTYQYQILCHQSSNGQTPFVSNNLCLREAETEQELKDFAILIEEIFKRRIKGVKDKHGHYTTPLFPKLLYWICDGLNYDENDPYFYLTELAAECNAYRMQPDIVSEKQTRHVKEGQIIPSMGCRSLLSPIWEEHTYPIDTKFYWVEGNGAYPYGTFVEKRDFSTVPNGEYIGDYENASYPINFRGNTGWLIKKTDTEVTIKEPKVYGRWNNGVITLNLPHVALEAVTKGEDFFELLDKRLELCRQALQIRYKRCQEIKSINSSILWQYGALARLNDNQTVGDLMRMYPKRASISLGYVGLYETCMALIGKSNSTKEGQELSKKILGYMNQKCYQWKENDKINYSIYGTPEENLTQRFALALRRDFGLIDKITDKDYVVNSYHIDPREQIDAFTKLEIEGQYLALSNGGAVSYIETGDLTHNISAIIKVIQWMADKIVYAEINRVIGICYECGYEGQMTLTKTDDGKFEFICPVCGNKDDDKMSVKCRLCGYLGSVNAGNANKGRLDDIFHRVLHLDCYDENAVQEVMQEAYELKNS